MGTLCVMAVLSPGCAADVPDDAPDVEASEEPLATVRLSDTHTISFFARGDDGGEVLESANMDLDGELVLGTELKVEHGHYADAYRQLAGAQLDPKALARLEDFDARAALAPHSDDDVAPAELAFSEPTPLAASTAPIDKDIASDIDWFRITYCNGCNGTNANRQPGAPAHWPACTTNPEYCQAAWQNLTYQRKSKNYVSHAVNYSETQNMTFAGYRADTCENSSWWEKNFGDCRWEGTRLFFMTLAPRAIQRAGATNGTSWTRRFEVRSPDNAGLMVDVY